MAQLVGVYKMIVLAYNVALPPVGGQRVHDGSNGCDLGRF